MPSHHVETFRDDAPAAATGRWGWQCFTPGCGEEQTGLPTYDAADEAADQHRHESEA